MPSGCLIALASTVFASAPPEANTRSTATAPPPAFTMAVDATPSLLLTPSDGPIFKGDVNFDGGVFLGAALLRDPSVAMGYQGTLGFRSINGGDRVWSFTSRHMLAVTGIDRRPQPFFYKVALGGHFDQRETLSGGPSLAVHLGWALGRPSRAHRVSVALVPAFDFTLNRGVYPMLGLSIGWLWI